MKGDIEGSEILFLLGATKLLETVRPRLYIEVSDSNADLATKMLQSFKYRIFTVSPDGSEKPTDRCKINPIAKPY